MKKIFCYAGSNNPKSTTRKVCSQLLIELNQLITEKTKIKIYDGRNTQILPIENAKSFFDEDDLDNKDSMTDIKNDILSSQIIILGSPVYFHNVSGNMKNFIDRLSYLTHLFPFIDKGATGVVVVCGSYLGSNEVVKYLIDFEEHLGLGNISVIEYNSNCMSFADLRHTITLTSKKIAKNVNDNIMNYSVEQKRAFNRYLQYYNSLNIKTKETEYWYKRKRLH